MWNEKTFGKFVYLSDVQVSSDGLIAYVLTKVNFNENKYENTIVLERNKERKYVSNALMPRFSPCGKKLTYIRKDDEGKKVELYLLDINSLSSRKLAEMKNINWVQWNNDCRRLLISSIKRRDDQDLWFEDEIPIWFDNKGFLDGEEVLLQVFDTEAGEVLDTYTLPRFSNGIWFGDHILCNVPKRDNPYKKFDIILLDGNGKREYLFKNVSFKAVDTEENVILLLGKPKKKSIMEHDYVYIYKNGEAVPLTEQYGYENSDPKIDNGIVFFKTYKEGKIVLELYSESGKKTIVDKNGGVTYYDIKNGLIAYILMTDTNPSELYIVKEGKTMATSYNKKVIDMLEIHPHKHFRYNSFDGRIIDGWYIEPERKGKAKYPLIVFVHGGPKGMYGYRFNILMHLLAKKGFYIMFVNPRGSSGYSEEFALKVVKRTGLEDFKDIMSGIECFTQHIEDVDNTRIGITGISYGGFMTNWAIANSDIFSAAVSENGISYWFTSFAFSDIGLWFDREIIGNNPFRNRNFRKLSPIFYADRVKTPVLFIHSLEDYRCPLDQSVMFYHVLKDLGKEAYIAIFKKGSHGHSTRGKPIHRVKRYKIITEFFIAKLQRKSKKFDIEKILKDMKT